MRDPKRIDAVLEAVRKAWEKEPDLRLCQLIHNAVAASKPWLHGADHFHIEDDVVVSGIRKLLGEED